MKGRTYEASAIISAHDRASKVFARIGRGADRMQNRANRAMKRALVFSTRAAKLAGLAAAGGFALGVKRAAEFEDKMADVRKVMEFDTPQGFENLSNELLEMSKTMPNTAADLAAIAAVAGQSGTAMEDLTRFTELSAKAATAFGMSAEDTATSLASIREQLGLTQTELEKNADVTNALANNLNATEGQVLDFNKRVAAYGKQAGFANDETQAFGAAMIATGAEANVAATSFRNMAKALTAGDSATKRQKSTLKKLGLDSKKVSESMQENAVGTVIDLLEKLNELPEAARGAAALDLFGSEARALTPLITNVDLLRKSLGIAKDETKTLNAVNKEYQTRLQTTVEQAKIFRNRLDAMLIKIGQAALPTINKMFDPMATGIENSIDFMMRKLEDFSKFLDGFFTGLGFEGGTSAAMSALGDQLAEIFGAGEGVDRGEALAQAFQTGKAAGEALQPVLEDISDSLKYLSEIELPNLDFVSADMVGNLVAYGVAMGTLNLALKTLIGIKLTPIRSLVKLLGKLAGMAVGIGATAAALDKVSKASGAVDGKDKKKKPKPRPRGWGRFGRMAGKGLSIPTLLGGYLAGEVLEDAWETFTEAGQKVKRDRQIANNKRAAEADKQWRKRMAANPALQPGGIFGGLERRHNLNGTNGPAQKGGGADRRDVNDPRIRFPNVSNDIVSSVKKMAEDVKKAADITNQLEMTPAGKVSAEITGDVTAELEGKADVNIKIDVRGPASVTGATVSGTGNIAPSVGTDTTGVGP